MRESIKKYNTEIAKIRSNVNIVPLLTSQFHVVRAIYTLALRMDENISTFKSKFGSLYEKISEPFRVQMDNLHHELIASIDRVRQIEDKAALVAVIDDISVRLIVSIQGILSIAPQYDRNFSSYADYYDSSFLKKDEVKETLMAAYSHIFSNRLTLNILNSLPNYVGASEAHIPDILDSAEYFKESATSADFYVFAPSSQSYSCISTMKTNNPYKKIITGNSADATISTRFDMSIFALTFMYEYYDPDKVDMDDNFRKFFTFMNAHTAVGGVEVIGLPKIFLNPYVIGCFSGYLENMHIVSLGPVSRFAAVIGNRKAKYDRDMNAIMDALTEVLTSAGEFTIGFSNQQVDKIAFRSAYPTAEEIASSFTNAKGFIERMNAGLIKDLALKTEEESRHPLLPFSPGQLGLVLVSGDIDGVIQEDGTFAHVIKGSTVKHPERTVEYDAEGNRVIKITHSNTTSVMMLTGDGTFKSLI